MLGHVKTSQGPQKHLRPQRVKEVSSAQQGCIYLTKNTVKKL